MPVTTAIAKIRYTHDAMIDAILAAPMISQGDLARHFGYTETWVSLVINSDAFKARLALRRDEVIDPAILASIEDTLKVIAKEAGVIVHRELVERKNPHFALKALSASATALGLGSKAPVEVHQTNVVVVPAKEANSAAWLEKYSPARSSSDSDQGRAGVIDVEAIRESQS